MPGTHRPAPSLHTTPAQASHLMRRLEELSAGIAATQVAEGLERRHLPSRAALLRRVAQEYVAMPGLRLTLPQAQRLFGLREDVCVRVLQTLTEARVVHRDDEGCYVASDG